MNVLQVGTIDPSLANALKTKYQALQLPNDSTRTAFLAEHGASVTATVDFGPPGVDADLMKALPSATVRSLSMMRELVLRNLDQYLTYGTLITPVVPTNRHVRNGIHT